jgi:hypothetical protein
MWLGRMGLPKSLKYFMQKFRQIHNLDKFFQNLTSGAVGI